METVDTGDIVLHKPTQEKWVVAYADGGRVCVFGWPLTEAPVAECSMFLKATPKSRVDCLYRMRNIKDQTDPRYIYAVERLSW